VILSISAKCSDLCYSEVRNLTGDVIFERDGYVPGGFQISDDEDYVTFEVNLDTGMIVGFKPMSTAAIKKAIEKNS